MIVDVLGIAGPVEADREPAHPGKPRAADVEKLAGTRAPKSARGANEGAAIEDLSAEIAGF